MSGEATKEAVGVTDRAMARITAAEVSARHQLMEGLELMKTRVAFLEAQRAAERQEARTVRIVAEPEMMPKKATKGAAGLDLRSAINAKLSPGERKRVPTGVKIALPPGHEGQVRPRSGMSLAGIDVAYGTVDADYRGEISVVVVNNTGHSVAINYGDRIAQLVIQRLPVVEIVAVDALDQTDRGESGFGSSGVR